MLYENCFGFLSLFTDYFKTTSTYISNLFGSKKEAFYYLSLINDENRGWSIHGLWPQYSSNSYPTFCRNVDFDINKLQSIINDLHNHWYSTTEKDADFWEHEWKKHGSCMFNNCDEFNYFRKSLELFITAVEGDIIKKFQTSETKSMIPFDINFNIIYND